MSDLNFRNMMCLDIYLNSLTFDEYKSIQPKLKKPTIVRHPLMCWDVYISKKFLDEKKVVNRQRDIKLLESMKKKFNWDICVPEVLASKYDALVLTDTSKIIQWVNDGFPSMTGFRAEEAIGQSPRFLQGPLTSADSLETLKKGFGSAKPFSGEVINYRKDGEIYACKLTIFPLKNAGDQIVNYLALENEYAF